MNLLYSGTIIKKKLIEQNGINKIKIATAFISQYGIDVLKEIIKINNISKENVELYLSYKFTDEGFSEILNQLINISKIKLIDKLHAKVYFLEGEKNLLIYGSANFTKGGLISNLEFYNMEEDQKIIQDNILSLNLFFEKCKEKGTLVDKILIEKYKNYENELNMETEKNYNLVSSKIFKDIIGINSTIDNDPKYNKIENFYFNKEDYETFEKYNVNENNSNIRYKRKIIQQKLLDINNDIKDEIKKYNLYNHWNPDNITSSIIPNIFNNYAVNWIGIRYGRNKEEIDSLNVNLSSKDDSKLGFQKYSCLQFNLTLTCFEVGIYHAVTHDAVDRMIMREKLEKNNVYFKNRLLEELQKLKGNNLNWNIWSKVDEKEKIFSIDTEDINNFIQFYLDNDIDGCSSSIMFQIAPNDQRLKNKEEIEKLILEKIKILIPLYKIIIEKNT